MKKYKNILVLLLILLISIFSKSVFAQVNPNFNSDTNNLNLELLQNIIYFQDDLIENGPEVFQKTEAFKQGEPASCFDYYTFGSVDLNFTQDKSTYDLLFPMIINGRITNNNRFPITNLTVRARLVRDTPNPEYLRSEIITVDDFIVAENITLDKNKSFDVLHTYSLPLNTPKGDYQIYFYAYNNDRFNQSGLSFTNDIVGSKISFKVSQNNPQHVYLDQTRISLNGKSHNVMAFMTQHDKDTSVEVSIPLVNPSQKTEDMTVEYVLYKWDSLRKENIVDTRTETVSVPANGEIFLKYNTSRDKISVYFLNIKANNTKQKKDISVYNVETQSNIRFVINSNDFPRINAFGVDNYPIKANQETTLFTCYHNGSDQETLNPISIVTTLYDEKGKVISSTEYDGKLVPDISAIVKKFIPKKDIFNYRVVTEMKDDNGVLLDKIENEYNCKDIDPAQCPLPKNYVWVWIVVGLIAVLSFLIILFKTRKKNNMNKISNKIHKIMMLVFAIASLFCVGEGVEAAVVTSDYIQFITPRFIRHQQEAKTNFIVEAVIQKEVNLVNESNANIGLNSQLETGKILNFNHSPATGGWFTTGGFYDSPPADSNHYVSIYANDRSSLLRWFIGVHLPTEKNKPKLTSSNPSVVECIDDRYCVGKSSGTSSVTVSFPQTVQTDTCTNTNPFNVFVPLNSIQKNSVIGGRINNSLIKGSRTILSGTSTAVIDGKIVRNCLAYTQAGRYVKFPIKPGSRPQAIDNTGYSSLGLFADIFSVLTGDLDSFDRLAYPFDWGSGIKLHYSNLTDRVYTLPNLTYTITVPPRELTAVGPQVITCAPATNVTTNSVTIPWNYSDPNNDPQTSYLVQLNRTAFPNNSSMAQSYSVDFVGSPSTNNGNNTSHAFTGLTPDTTYYYRIATHNGSDSWGPGYKNCGSFTTAPTPPAPVCNCVNRDFVCRNSNDNSIISTETSAGVCQFDTACEVSADAVNTTFRIIPLNPIGNGSGNIEYNRSGNIQLVNKSNSYTYTLPKTNNVQSLVVVVKDLFDNQTVTRSCSINNDPNANPNFDPNAPSIKLEKTPSITLNKGGSCTIDWEIINMPEGVACTLTDKGSIPLVDGISQDEYVATSIQQNKKFTLTCSGGTLSSPVSKSTICRVNPKIIEN